MKQNNQNQLIGLHRPYNKPLKSLIWVCRYIKSEYIKDNTQSLYISFFIYHIKSIIRNHKSNIDYTDGLISFDTAKYIHDNIINNNPDFELYIKKILTNRISKDDKNTYSAYKNTSYYITLAKKLQLIGENNYLTQEGAELIASRSSFYKLSKYESASIFKQLLRCDFENFITLLITHHASVKYKDSSISIFSDYILKKNGRSTYKYVKSFDKNYIIVMQSWIEQLGLLTKRGALKESYIEILKEENYFLKFVHIKDDFNEYLINNFMQRYKRGLLYKKLKEAYKQMINNGKHDCLFVNLYDIMSEFKMSFSRFNIFINHYYNENKTNDIILLSNTVASIDKRKRFNIDGIISLKIKIIEKKTYGNK